MAKNRESNFSLYEENRDRNETRKLKNRLKSTLLFGYSKKSVKKYLEEMEESESRVRDNFERQIQDLSEESSRNSKECTILRSQMAEVEEDKKKLLEEFENELKKFEETKQSLENDKYLLKEENSRLEKGISDLKEFEYEYEDAKNQLDEMRRTCESMNDQKEAVDKLTKQLQEAEEENSRLKQQLEETFSSKSIVTLRNSEPDLASLFEDPNLRDTERKLKLTQDRCLALLNVNKRLMEEKKQLLQFINDFKVDDVSGYFARRKNSDNIAKVLLTAETYLNQIEEESKYQNRENQKKQENLTEMIELLKKIREDSDNMEDKNLLVFNELEKILNNRNK